MTKRKAIELAVKCDCVRYHDRWCTGKIGPDVAADRAYDAGFIAGLAKGRIDGLEEAAGIVEPPPDNPCVDAEEYAIAKDWLEETAARVRIRANALVKKARTNGK